jgi:hypothetical protein
MKTTVLEISQYFLASAYITHEFTDTQITIQGKKDESGHVLVEGIGHAG